MWYTRISLRRRWLFLGSTAKMRGLLNEPYLVFYWQILYSSKLDYTTLFCRDRNDGQMKMDFWKRLILPCTNRSRSIPYHYLYPMENSRYWLIGLRVAEEVEPVLCDINTYEMFWGPFNKFKAKLEKYSNMAHRWATELFINEFRDWLPLDDYYSLYGVFIQMQITCNEHIKKLNRLKKELLEMVSDEYDRLVQQEMQKEFEKQQYSTQKMNQFKSQIWIKANKIIS